MLFTEGKNLICLQNTTRFGDVGINIMMMFNYLLEDNCILIFLQVILANCLLLMAANLELRSDKTPDFTAKYAELSNSEVGTPPSSTSCNSAGVFAINCTSYLICIPVIGGFIGDEATCPSQQIFDPKISQCSSSNICPSCTKESFVCLNNTSFILCAAAGVEVASNQSYPSGHYCNMNCKFPCLSYVDPC